MSQDSIDKTLHILPFGVPHNFRCGESSVFHELFPTVPTPATSTSVANTNSMSGNSLETIFRGRSLKGSIIRTKNNFPNLKKESVEQDVNTRNPTNSSETSESAALKDVNITTNAGFYLAEEIKDGTTFRIPFVSRVTEDQKKKCSDTEQEKSTSETDSQPLTEFSNVILWDHDRVPSTDAQRFVMSVNTWGAMARIIHGKE